MKRLPLPLLAALALLAWPAWAQTAPPTYGDSLIATVNGEAITSYDLTVSTRGLHLLLMPTRDRAEERRREEKIVAAADTLVDNLMVYREFQRRDWRVPLRLLEREYNKILVREAGGDREKFEEMLIASRLPPREFRDRLRRRMAAELVYQEFVDRRVVVTPTETADYLNAHRAELQKVTLFAIRFATAKENAEQRLELARQRLAKGDAFADVAREMGDNPNPEAGGQLGTFELGQLREEFVAAIGAVPAGQVTTARVPGDGHYLLRAEEAGSYEDLLLRAEKQLRQEKAEKRRTAYLERLRAESYVHKMY